MRAVAVALLLLAGCGGLSLRPVNPNHVQRKAEVTGRLGIDEPNLNQVLQADQVECDRLDNRVLGWTATSIVLGVAGGGSGVTAMFTESTPRYVTGGIGVGMAALTALSAYMSTQYAQRYARRCTVNLGGK